MKILIATLAFALSSAFAVGQVPYSEEQFRVYDANGNAASIEQVLKALDATDVVFLGEEHDDPVTHAIEAEIFKRAVAQYLAKRKVALSLEMFERDVQIVVDEYLSGLISEDHFLLSSRPWKNYKTDYRPLVELAKQDKLTVIAANAPRRYVNMISRNVREALNALSNQAKAWLAPLPYGQPSPSYEKKFRELMAGAPEATKLDNIVASQSLWDATMANSVANYLSKNKHALVVHLNGSFHTASRLGTVEHLLKYRPKTRVLVVTMRPSSDFKTFDKAKDTGTGDFVILTAPPQRASILSEILRRMGKHHEALLSMMSDVTMSRYDSQLKVSDTYRGITSYLPPTATRPVALRVDWTKPVEEQVFLVGENYELYRPRSNQVISGRVNGLNNGTGAALGFMSMTKDQLRSNYDLKYIGQEEVRGGVKTWRLELTSKITADYRTAELWVDADGMPLQVKITAKNSDTTTVLLSNIVKNVTMNAGIFKPSYPATVKRIRF